MALHFAALKAKLANQSVIIITDEITDCCDQSSLNVIASICGESFLIDVITLEECNHQTLSQACIQAVTHVDMVFEDIVAFVTDSAKKLQENCCQMSLLTVMLSPYFKSC